MRERYVAGWHSASGAGDAEVQQLRQSLQHFEQASCTAFKGAPRPMTSPVHPQRPFGAEWASNTQDAGPVIKFNTSLAPEWTVAQDIERQLRVGNPLPGFNSHSFKLSAHDQNSSTDAASSQEPRYRPPVPLVLLSSQLQRLGPSTPFRYTAHSLLGQQQQPLMSPPGPAGAADLRSSGNVKWAADTGTQTVPGGLAADAARMGEQQPWACRGSCCCCHCCGSVSTTRSSCSCSSSCQRYNAHALACRQFLQQQQQGYERSQCMKQQCMHAAARNCSCGGTAHITPAAAAECDVCAARQAERIIKARCTSESNCNRSSPWRLAMPAAAAVTNQPWVPAGIALDKVAANAVATTAGYQTDNVRQPHLGGCTGSFQPRTRSAAVISSNSTCSPSRQAKSLYISRTQAAEAARAKACRQLDVSAKYAALGRAGAAETAAAAAAAAAASKAAEEQRSDSSSEADSPHEVAVIITTSPQPKQPRKNVVAPVDGHTPYKCKDILQAATAACKAAGKADEAVATATKRKQLLQQRQQHAKPLPRQPGSGHGRNIAAPKLLLQLMRPGSKLQPSRPAWVPAGTATNSANSSASGGSSKSGKASECTAALTCAAEIQRTRKHVSAAGSKQHMCQGNARNAAGVKRSLQKAGRAGKQQSTKGHVKPARNHCVHIGNGEDNHVSQQLEQLLLDWTEKELSGCSSIESWELPDDESETAAAPSTAHAPQNSSPSQPATVSTAAALPPSILMTPVQQQPEADLAANMAIQSPKPVSAEQLVSKAEDTAKLEALSASLLASNKVFKAVMAAVNGGNCQVEIQSSRSSSDGCSSKAAMCEQLSATTAAPYPTTSNAGMSGSVSQHSSCTDQSHSQSCKNASAAVVASLPTAFTEGGAVSQQASGEALHAVAASAATDHMARLQYEVHCVDSQADYHGAFNATHLADTMAAAECPLHMDGVDISNDPISCQSSFQTDLAIAYDEDARLAALLRSSSSSSGVSPPMVVPAADDMPGSVTGASAKLQTQQPGKTDSGSSFTGVEQLSHLAERQQQQQSDVEVHIAGGSSGTSGALQHEESSSSLATLNEQLAAMLSPELLVLLQQDL